MYSKRSRLANLRSVLAAAALAIVASAIIAPSTSRSWAATNLGDPMPIGVLQLLPDQPSCIAGYRCKVFVVEGCANLQAEMKGTMAQAGPAKGVSPRGMVVFFKGGEGAGWWNSGDGIAGSFLSNLRQQDRFVTVQVHWSSAWYAASFHEDAGQAHAACRPATVVRWIHDNLYVPLKITRGPGECGFCITGNSGGSSAVAYALSHYGLEGLLDAVISTSGPTMSSIDKGCLPEYPEYNFTEWSTPQMDRAFGYFDEINDPGPCIRQDRTKILRWQEESIVAGARDLSYPTVRVEDIIGGLDSTPAPYQAGDYRDALQLDPTNHFTWTLVPDMHHTIQSSPSGLNALEVALLGSL
jgi:hypothetical protein